MKAGRKVNQFTGSKESREALLEEMERRTELPLLILSIVMIPLLLGPFLWTLSATEDTTFFALDTFIWAIFAVDLAAKVAVTTNRPAYLKSHWLELLVVLVPFARPLRIVRLIVFGSRAFVGAGRFAHADFLLVYAIGLIVIGATAVTTLEAGQDSQIGSFSEALWWSVVTITTVGYGDVVPVTAEGRAFAIVLMVGGIGIFGGLTAQLASFFVRQDAPQGQPTDNLAGEISLLKAEIIKLQEQVGAQKG